MAELLVDAQAGEVVYVAEDGHRWGIRESREAYDEHVRDYGVPKTRKVDVVIAQPKRLKSAIDGVPPLPITLYMPETERFDETPPPDRLGVIKVPGVPASEFEYLLEQGEDGRRTRTLELSESERADIVEARNTLRDRSALERVVKTRGTVRGD